MYDVLWVIHFLHPIVHIYVQELQVIEVVV